jgi:hypothetical protein
MLAVLALQVSKLTVVAALEILYKLRILSLEVADERVEVCLDLADVLLMLGLLVGNQLFVLLDFLAVQLV